MIIDRLILSRSHLIIGLLALISLFEGVADVMTSTTLAYIVLAFSTAYAAAEGGHVLIAHMKRLRPTPMSATVKTTRGLH